MDILFLLLFAAIAYLGPKLAEKLWKAFQLKIGNYGNLQANGLQGNKETSFTTDEVVNPAPSVTEYQLESGLEVVPALVPPVVATAPDLPEEKVAWRGKMDANAVINGVIFAEIVQPPRAYRPFTRRK